MSMFCDLLPLLFDSHLNKRAWYDYCLINPSGRADKFYADDRFGETIIKLNKEKIQLSANAKTDHFFKEIVALNQLSLWKSKLVMAQATRATNHGNRHAVVDTNHDIKVIVDLFVLEKPFEQRQDRGSGENNKTQHTNLFSISTTKIALRIPLKNYKVRAQRNWAQRDVALSRAAGRPDEQVVGLFDDNLGDVMERSANISDGDDN